MQNQSLQPHSGVSQQFGGNDRQDMLRKILRSGVEGNTNDSIGISHLKTACNGIMFPYQKLVIPMVFQPPAEGGFDDGEVDHTPDRIKFFCIAVKLKGIVVSMNFRTF